MTQKQQKKSDRMAEMVRMRQAGVSHGEIAKFFGTSTKTVQRTLKASGQFSLPDSVYRCKAKEQKLVLAVAEGLSGRQAMIEAGYAESTADSAASEVMGRPRVRRALRDLLLSAISEDEVLEAVRNGLGATQKQYFSHQGKVRDVREDADLGMRHRYLELYGKFTGALKQEGEITVPVQVIVDL